MSISQSFVSILFLAQTEDSFVECIFDISPVHISVFPLSELPITYFFSIASQVSICEDVQWLGFKLMVNNFK